MSLTMNRILRTSHCLRSTRPTAPVSASARQRRVAASNRLFATAQPPPPLSAEDNAVLLASPDPNEIQKMDLDVELPDPSEVRLTITERAAEQLRRISAKENNPDIALRIAVESGGCHGYQYKMSVTASRAPDDYLFSRSTPSPSKIVIDAISLNLLKGSTVDYATELIGSAFRISDNPQAKGNGCGCGVSWEAKV